MLGQDLLAAADFRRDIFELHSQQQRVFGEMEDAIVALGKDDHLVAGLLQAAGAASAASRRAPPPWPRAHTPADTPSPARTSAA